MGAAQGIAMAGVAPGIGKSLGTVIANPVADDFIARKGEEQVDRKALLRTLTAFLKANDLKADWEGIQNAPDPDVAEVKTKEFPEDDVPTEYLEDN